MENAVEKWLLVIRAAIEKAVGPRCYEARCVAGKTTKVSKDESTHSSERNVLLYVVARERVLGNGFRIVEKFTQHSLLACANALVAAETGRLNRLAMVEARVPGCDAIRNRDICFVRNFERSNCEVAVSIQSSPKYYISIMSNISITSIYCEIYTSGSALFAAIMFS